MIKQIYFSYAHWAVYIKDAWIIISGEKTVNVEEELFSNEDLKEFYYYNFMYKLDYTFDDVRDKIEITEL